MGVAVAIRRVNVSKLAPWRSWRSSCRRNASRVIVMAWPSLLRYRVQCRKILCEKAKAKQKITYAELAKALGLPSPKQNWKTVLDPISVDEVQRTGRDLTLVVVYSQGQPAQGLSRYFSNVRGGQKPRTTMLDPNVLMSALSSLALMGVLAPVRWPCPTRRRLWLALSRSTPPVLDRRRRESAYRPWLRSRPWLD